MYILKAALAILLMAPKYISCKGGGQNSQKTAEFGEESDDFKFGYDGDNGPETWGFLFPDCNGRYQSPIDIDTNNFEHRQALKSFKWTNLNKVPKSMTIEKKETSFKVKLTWNSKRSVPSISGGPLAEKYYLDHFHFHWNTSSDSGSEHSVNGIKYPMELHVVYNTRLNRRSTGGEKTLVTGFMMNLTDTDHPGFGNIIDGSEQLTDGETSVDIKPFSLKHMRFDFCEDYVFYIGSLTTPPCTGEITWLISSRPLLISKEQYELFKKSVSISGRPYTANVRPIQDTNGRKVVYMVSPGCGNTSGRGRTKRTQ